MRNILCYILSCAVNGTELEAERLKGVPPEEWQEVYLMGKVQGVTGLLFDKVKSFYLSLRLYIFLNYFFTAY